MKDVKVKEHGSQEGVQISPLDYLSGNHRCIVEERLDESFRRPIYWKKSVVEEWDKDDYVNEKEDSGHMRSCLRTDLVT